MPSFKGILFTDRYKICSQDSALSYSYGENPESLSHLGLNRYRVVTDKQTDGQNYDSEYALSTTCAVARKNHADARKPRDAAISLLQYSSRTHSIYGT